MEKIKIISWNILCKQYCNEASFPKALSASLDWDMRKQRLAAYLRENPVDLIYLTEVDTYQEWCGPLLAELGYRVIVELRSDVIAYRKPLAISYKERIFYGVGSQFYIRIDTPQLILFCTHLKSKPAHEATRLSQATQLRKAVEPLLGKYNVAICGDFNDYPDSNTLKVLCGSDMVVLSDAIPMTSFKIRDAVDKGVKDYFLFSPSRTCQNYEAVVTTIDDALVSRIDEERGLPNEDIGSDHLPLLLELETAMPRSQSRFDLVGISKK